MPIRVGVNGFGRIGRNCFVRRSSQRLRDCRRHDLTDAASCTLLTSASSTDSVHGKYPDAVVAGRAR